MKMPPSEFGCPSIRKQGSCNSGFRDVADPRYHGLRLRTPISIFSDCVRSVVARQRDLDKIPVTTLDGNQITFGDMPALTYADGLLVLHKGKIIYEKYFGRGFLLTPD